MNGLWWAQTALTLIEIIGVFWGTGQILRIKVKIKWKWFWGLGIAILAGLTVYQRTLIMYSRWWLTITILFCGILVFACQKQRMLIWLFQLLYFETLYCMDLFLYIAFKMFCGEQDFLTDQHVLMPERIFIYLISRSIMAGILFLLYKRRGEVVQFLKNGKLIWGVVAALEHISLFICDEIFIPGMENKAIDRWKSLLFFYPFLLAIMAFFFIWQRYRLAYIQINSQNELYASRFQALEKEHR